MGPPSTRSPCSSWARASTGRRKISRPKWPPRRGADGSAAPKKKGVMGTERRYRRVLLKLSGEALMGEQAFGISRATIEKMVEDIAQVVRLKIELAIVIGGGNIFRGVALGSSEMERAT